MSINFGMALPAVLSPRTIVSIARFLEAIGVQRLWMPDHMLFPDLAPASDPWSIFAAAAAVTSRVQFGSAVSDVHRVHPAVLAHRVATLDQLSRGRILLGLGSGEAMSLDPFGIPWNRRVARVRESLQVLRGLLDSDAPFTFDGDFYQLKDARLSVHPWKRRRMPIYLAAMGPLMQKIGGAYADGWLPLPLPADHYASYYAPMVEAARANGRHPDSIDRVAVVCVVLLQEGHKVTAADIARHMRPHALTIVWPPVARRMGLDFNPPEHLKDADYAGVNPCDAESMRRHHELRDWVPEDMLPQFAIWGTPREVKRQLGDYVDAGATSFEIFNASKDPLGSTLTLAADIMPYFMRRSAPILARMARSALPLARRAGLVKGLRSL